MSDANGDIRNLIRQMVREQIGEAIREELTCPGAAATSNTPSAPEAAHRGAPHSAPAVNGAQPHPSNRPVISGTGGVSTSRARQREVRRESVRIVSDAELDQFVRHLLVLFENPKNREDIRHGLLGFTLATPAAYSGEMHATRARLDRGVVTERRVAEAAAAGESLLLTAGVVVTPLALEKARSLNVQIEREAR